MAIDAFWEVMAPQATKAHIAETEQKLLVRYALDTYV